jgi:succinate dehydrogenase flavin-adding protein (antitoxin of CptAB toxin-antitoxin module)
MRELDELLLAYLENRYASADAGEKAAFRELLTLADPEVNAYLLQRQPPPSEPIARVIDSILSRNSTR